MEFCQGHRHDFLFLKKKQAYKIPLHFILGQLLSEQSVLFSCRQSPYQTVDLPCLTSSTTTKKQ